MISQHMQKGHAKLRKGDKVLKSKKQQEKRQIQVNRNTWIYTSSDLPDEEIIANFNKKYGYE